MSRSVDTPWNPATTATLPRVERLADAVGPDLEDLGLAVGGVGDDARLRAGERHRRLAEVDDRHAQQRDRDALARGEQHVHLAAVRARSDTSWASRTRSSVVLPIAETTTTTSSPARRVRTMWSATARMRSGSATDVPPNFCTSRAHDRRLYRGRPPSSVRSCRRDSPSVDSAAVPKATKRERQRQNRDARAGDAGGREAPKRWIRTGRNLGLLLVPLVIIFVVLQVTQQRRQQQQERHETSTDARGPPKMTIDPAATYTATIDTSEGTIVVGLDAAHAPDLGEQLRVPRQEEVLRRTPGQPGRAGLRHPVGEPEQHHRRWARLLGRRRGPHGHASVPCRGDGVRQGRQRTRGHGRLAVVHRHRIRATRGSPPTTPASAPCTSGLDVAQKIGQLAPASGDGPPTEKVTIKKITIASTPGSSTTTAAPATTAAP